MSCWKITKTGEDEFVLSVGSKKYPYKRTVETARELDGMQAKARLQMLDYLRSIGRTKEDFIFRTEKNGTEIVDESEWRKFEEDYMNEHLAEYQYEFFQKMTGADIFELAQEVCEKDGEKGYTEMQLAFRRSLMTGDETGYRFLK